MNQAPDTKERAVPTAVGGAHYLTSENAAFFLTEGGLLGMRCRGDGGEEVFPRVVVLRAFPLTAPDSFLSVRLPSGDRRELGIIRHIGDLDEESRSLVGAELALRYYAPRILRVLSVVRRRMVFITAETDLGRRRITLKSPVGAVRQLEDGRVFLSDAEGNIYVIPDPQRLDKASFRRIEVFL